VKKGQHKKQNPELKQIPRRLLRKVVKEQRVPPNLSPVCDVDPGHQPEQHGADHRKPLGVDPLQPRVNEVEVFIRIPRGKLHVCHIAPFRAAMRVLVPAGLELLLQCNVFLERRPVPEVDLVEPVGELPQIAGVVTHAGRFGQ
jgi:hypothetical protein